MEQQHKMCYQDKVHQVLKILQEHNLFLQPKKCEFKQTSTKFLGIRVEHGTVHMDDKKVNKVKNWSMLKTVKQVQEFLGFTGYYQCFIKDYLAIAKPLLELTKKTVTALLGRVMQQCLSGFLGNLGLGECDVKRFMTSSKFSEIRLSRDLVQCFLSYLAISSQGASNARAIRLRWIGVV